MLSRLLRTTRKTLSHARDLRKFQETSAEHCLWFQLRNRKCGGLKFRRQVPLGPFIADFFCAEAHLVIELDGISHEEKENYDRARTQFFEEHGCHVLRFRNQEVLENMEGVLEEIVEYVKNRHTNILSPEGRETE